MPNATSPAKKTATKKASPPTKAAGKKTKGSKTSKAAKKPAANPKTAKKPEAGKKPKNVKKAGAKKPKASKAKTAPKANPTKVTTGKAVASPAVAKAPATLLDEFYAAHPQLRMPVVFFTFSEDPLEEDNRFASKVGGHPFWPALRPWNKSEMGGLRLFMQINFADVPSNHGIAGMPTDGIFQIYWNNYEAAANADDNAAQGPGTFVIRYWSAADVSAATLMPTTELPSLAGDNSMMGLDPTTPHGIEFRPATKMFVTRADYRFQDALSKWAKERKIDSETADQVDMEAHDRDVDADRGHGLLGGSPHSFNGDFRLIGEAEPYELLLQMKSEGPLMCGDCGLESFFMRPARLAARDFSNVLYMHDE